MSCCVSTVGGGVGVGVSVGTDCGSGPNGSSGSVCASASGAGTASASSVTRTARRRTSSGARRTFGRLRSHGGAGQRPAVACEARAAGREPHGDQPGETDQTPTIPQSLTSASSATGT